MRTLAYLRKTFLENLREWKILILTLTFAPFFVYLMYGYFAAAAPAYRLLVANHDRGALDETGVEHGQALIATWKQADHADGAPVFEVTEVPDVASAKAKVKGRDADLLVEIPAGFAEGLAEYRRGEASAPALLTNHSDQANVRSSMAMAMSDYVAFTYAFVATNASSPIDFSLETLGTTGTLSEFDLYIPALLVLALIMVMFTAAATLIKEVDKGTMSRLVLSKLSTAELLVAVSINQVLIGVVALGLALLAALSVGYRTNGSMLTVLVVGAVSALSVVAISVLVAAFMSTIYELLTVGCFPFFILMFFSESMFPLPKITVGELAGHTLYANDVLPTAVTVRVLNEVLNFGAGLGDIVFELGAILLLTLVYFALGIWLFRRRHQRY